MGFYESIVECNQCLSLHNLACSEKDSLRNFVANMINMLTPCKFIVNNNSYKLCEVHTLNALIINIYFFNHLNNIFWLLPILPYKRF